MNTVSLGGERPAGQSPQPRGESGAGGSSLANAALISSVIAAAMFSYVLLSVIAALTPGLAGALLAATPLLAGVGVILGFAARRSGADERATIGIVLGGAVLLASIMLLLYITPVAVVSSGG